MKKPESPRAPTMADVARIAGVSTMTVSRALKPDSYIKADTREKILHAVDELGYVMDITAAGLSSRKTGFVAMIIPSINNGNFAQTVHGASETLKNSRLQLLLAYTKYSIDEEEALVAQLLARRPEAIILTGGRHTEKCRRMLQKADIPVVETWDQPEQAIGSSVGFSNAKAAEITFDHLVHKGCQNITFLGGDHVADTRGFDRRSGYIEAAKANGREPQLVDLGEPPVTMESGPEAFDKLKEAYPNTDGLICVSDLLAFGVLMAAQRTGKNVPESFRLAGFGDYDIASISIPSITTVAVQPRQIGEYAAQRVLEALKNEDQAVGGHISVDTKLIERATSS